VRREEGGVRRKHHQLLVWQKAIALVTQVYEITSKFPAQETYGLTSQMRRCSVSVPANIAEGAARNSRREFVHFLGVARGSLSELETYVVIGRGLGYLQKTDELDQMIDEVFALLSGLINAQKRAIQA
jgi:four helix bundle protein